MDEEQNQSLTLTSWQASGIIRFLPMLLQILTNCKDGNTQKGIKIKNLSNKDMVNVVKFLMKFDKRTMIDFLEGKFFVAVDYTGKPCCRVVQNFRTIRNYYLDE